MRDVAALRAEAFKILKVVLATIQKHLTLNFMLTTKKKWGRVNEDKMRRYEQKKVLQMIGQLQKLILMLLLTQ